MTPPKAQDIQNRIPTEEWCWAAGGSLIWTLVLAIIPPTVFEGYDFLRFCDPVIHLFRTSVLDGEMPWWNPYSSLGRPFAVDMQTASFYPTTYLGVFLDMRTAWMIASMAHGMLAILGFTRLANWVGATRPAAWAGGIIFLFSAALLTRMQAGQVPYVYALCYLPLVIWLGGRLALTPTRCNWSALALAWGLQLLCSHPQVSWLSALGAGAFATGLLLQPPWNIALRSWLRTAFALSTAFACGMALLGFVIVPFLELAGQSDRALPSLAFSSSLPMVPLHWLSLIAPQSSVFPINWEYNIHTGVTVLIGGVAALTRWREPAIRGVACMIMVGLIIAVGEATPLFALLFKFLPGLSSFRIPARAGILVMLGLIMGASMLATAIPSGRRSRATVIAVGLLIAMIVTRHYFERMFPNTASMNWLLGRLAMLTISVVGWCLWLKWTPNESQAAAWGRRLFLPAVLIVESCILISNLKDLPVSIAQFPAEPAVVAAIQSHHLDRQVAPVRVSLPSSLIRENSGMIHHYATPTGSESLTLGRVSNYLHQAEKAYPNYAVNSGALNFSITPSTDSGVLTITPKPDPRVYVATHVTPVADSQTAITRMIAGHPFHEDVLIEQPWAGELHVAPSSGQGSAAITQFTLNSLEVSVDSPSDGILVIAEAWYPGWHASIAGHQVACLPVNGWMRGVPVPGGHSLVKLAFHQNGILRGTIISIAAALLLVWAARNQPAISLQTPLANDRAPVRASQVQ